MPISNTNVKMSDIQNEFGGTNPISISEYYRDVLLTPENLQDEQRFVTGSQQPINLSSNASIPLLGTIRIGNFRGTRGYVLNSVNYGGTGGRVYVPPDYPGWPYNGIIFSNIGGNISSYARYGRVVHSFSISENLLPVRLRIEPVLNIIIQGWFRSGGLFGDNDFSYIGNPGYRITDPGGSVLIETYAPASPNSYDNLSLSLSAQTVVLSDPGTYNLTIFAEAMYDEPEEIAILANMIWPATTITYCSI
jgi:hypothetical protein